MQYESKHTLGTHAMIKIPSFNISSFDESQIAFRLSIDFNPKIFVQLLIWFICCFFFFSHIKHIYWISLTTHLRRTQNHFIPNTNLEFFELRFFCEWKLPFFFSLGCVQLKRPFNRDVSVNSKLIIKYYYSVEITLVRTEWINKISFNYSFLYW